MWPSSFIYKWTLIVVLGLDQSPHETTQRTKQLQQLGPFVSYDFSFSSTTKSTSIPKAPHQYITISVDMCISATHNFTYRNTTMAIDAAVALIIRGATTTNQIYNYAEHFLYILRTMCTYKLWFYLFLFVFLFRFCSYFFCLYIFKHLPLDNSICHRS